MNTDLADGVAKSTTQPTAEEKSAARERLLLILVPLLASGAVLAAAFLAPSGSRPGEADTAWDREFAPLAVRVLTWSILLLLVAIPVAPFLLALAARGGTPGRGAPEVKNRADRGEATRPEASLPPEATPKTPAAPPASPTREEPKRPVVPTGAPTGGITRNEVDRLLASHRNWLKGAEGGESSGMPSWSGRGRQLDLQKRDLSGFDLLAVDLSRANLIEADLSKASLSGATLVRADLSGANLQEAELGGAFLTEAVLTWATLSGANLSGANLRVADLSGADLRGADLNGADLSGATLSGAKLFETYLTRANLAGVNLDGANLYGTRYHAAARPLFPMANLANVDLTPSEGDIISAGADARTEAFLTYLRTAYPGTFVTIGLESLDAWEAYKKRRAAAGSPIPVAATPAPATGPLPATPAPAAQIPDPRPAGIGEETAPTTDPEN